MPSPLAMLVVESFCARQRLHASLWPGGTCEAVDGVLLSRLPGAELLQVAMATPFARHPVKTAADWYGEEEYALWLPEGVSSSGAVVTDRYTGMAAPIEVLAAHRDDGTARIEEVDSDARRDDHVAVLVGIGLSDEEALAMFPLGLFTGADVLALVGYVDDEPAGAAWALASGPVLGLFNVVTDPAHRRRGLLRSMVGTIARHRVGAHCSHVVVHCADGEEAYERLGFTAVTRFAVVTAG